MSDDRPLRELVWSLLLASLKRDLDELNRLVNGLDLEDAQSLVYLLAEANGHHWAHLGRLAPAGRQMLIDQLTFAQIERAFHDDGPDLGTDSQPER